MSAETFQGAVVIVGWVALFAIGLRWVLAVVDARVRDREARDVAYDLSIGPRYRAEVDCLDD